MQTFTAFDYLCIDVANQFGLDKLKFEERIQWTKDNIKQLEELAASKVGKWKEKPLYLKAVQSMRKVQQGNPTGHLVGFDATCSGLQIMSALTGCKAGASATGLIDPDRRADAYTDCLNLMRQYVPALPDTERGKIKDAVMTAFYGSKKEPQNLFGEGSEELEAFYKALTELSPGACELLEDLRQSWQPYASKHSWVLPDNHHVHVKVMDKIDTRIQIDELNGSTFTYRYEDNVGKEKGLSNIANVVHSVDAYLLRTLIRRCNYSPEIVEGCLDMLEVELLIRSCGTESVNGAEPQLQSKINRFNDTQMVDITICNILTDEETKYLSTDHIRKLMDILRQVLSHKPFPVVTVHDEFRCHAGNMNQLRYHYKEIMAELAESSILDDIMSSIYGQGVRFEKLSSDLAKSIRNSNYSIC